jgi:uncharacterized membrane protein YccC
MPELTWTTALAWFGVIAGAASVASLIAGLISTWQTNRLIANVHVATQTTLTDMRKGFSETQERLGEAIKGIGDGQTRLGEILERMDRAAEDRHRDLKDRLGGGAEA